MSTETRVLLVKPGDVLIFGNVTLDESVHVEALSRALGRVKKSLELRDIIIFADDIDMALVPDHLVPGDGPSA